MSTLKLFDAIKQQNEFIETLIIAAPLKDVKAHVRREKRSPQQQSLKLYARRGKSALDIS